MAGNALVTAVARQTLDTHVRIAQVSVITRTPHGDAQ
jgi:hypothetical protein